MICGVISHSGPNNRPLACAYLPGHDGQHSWSVQPAFGADEPGPLAMTSGSVTTVSESYLNELLQAAIEATDNTPRTARLRKALEAFGVR